MTDAPPPSIPPRSRPPAPRAEARPVRPVAGHADPGDVSGVDVRLAADEAHASLPAPSRSAAWPLDTSGADAAPRRTASSTRQATPRAAPDDGPVDASPLGLAVNQSSAWVRKAASATGTYFTSAYASLTRPRPKETEMIANPLAPSATSARPAGEGGAAGIGSPRPVTGRAPTASSGPRRVRLAVSQVDPWSVMKLAFLLSFAMGIMGVIAASVLWATLNGLHVFTNVNALITSIVGTESAINVLDYVQFPKVVSAATLVSVVDVFLLTALATIGAFLYNIVAALVGGVHVTMTDE